MENEQIIRQAAAEVGVPAHIALAFAQAESNGRMVYGHDAGGVHSTRDGAITVDGIEWPKGSNIPVTEASFRELERRVAAGEKSNGVGIMQITYPGFFPDARKKGLDLATAADNIRYGLTLIRGYLIAAAPEGVDPLTYAASRYNKGSVYSGPYHYTDRVNAYARAWALLEPKETPMRIALIHSQQPANQYAGGPAGVGDSEQAWMRRLALQVAPLLDAEVEVGPVGPDFNTNVRWANARHAVKPFDLLISLHSNAAGDAMILWGTSSASAAYGRKIMDALNADNPFPGDTWTYYDRKVAEVAKTAPPAVLLEVGRHDTHEYAQWLRDHINEGSLARNLARALNSALGLTAPADPLVHTTPLEDTMALSDADIDRIADAVWRRLITVPDGTQVNAGTALGGIRNDLRVLRSLADDDFRRTLGV